MATELRIDGDSTMLDIRIKQGGRAGIPVALFLMVWLTGWAFGEIFALASIFGKGTPLAVRGFFIVWVIPWTIGGGFAILALLRSLGGQERIEAGRGILKLTRSFFIIRFTRSYDIFRVSGLRKAAKHPSRYSIFKSGTIQFQYNGKEVLFGAGLSPSEKDELFRALQEHRDFSEKNFA